MPLLDTAAALVFGGDPVAARELGGPFVDDRRLDASRVLASLVEPT